MIDGFSYGSGLFLESIWGLILPLRNDRPILTKVSLAGIPTETRSIPWHSAERRVLSISSEFFGDENTGSGNGGSQGQGCGDEPERFNNRSKLPSTRSTYFKPESRLLMNWNDHGSK